ncbi:MAG: WG repeat-containing protein [Prevotella sp.]
MKKTIKVNLIAIIALFVAMMVSSCSNTEERNVEFIPFQETKDGNWGMISMDGKVLFEDEFKTKPTIVCDGRFFVRTNEGYWEMYDAIEKPQKIGGEYAHTSGFTNGRALVAEKGKPVSIIDTEGKTIKLLDKIDGKEVDGVRSFSEGYAIFMTTDSLWGAVDENGKCVIKPVYCSLNDCSDGKFLGVNNQYKKYLQKNNKDKVKISVIDNSGKVIFNFSANKYENTGYGYVDGKLAVSVKKDGKEICGIIDDKGNYIVKPSTKLKNIGNIHGDEFTYNNGEGWGLMNTKGENLVRAKYEYLYYDEEDILIAMVKDGDEYEYKYIDKNDNQIGTDTYVSATPFSSFDNEHAIVKPNDKIYSIINKQCKQLENLPDIINIGDYIGENYIESDYVDIKKLVNGFGISQNGIGKLTFSSSAKDGVAAQVANGSAPGEKEHPAGTPYWYDYTNEIGFFKNVNGVNGYIDVSYSGNLSRQTYNTHRVIDYTFGDWYWYHDEKTPTGYVWNKVTPQVFSLTIENGGKMHGKLKELLNALIAKFKTFGTIVKQNDGAAVLTLKNKLNAFIRMEKDAVKVSWGEIGSINDIDISKYKDITEEDNSSNLSYGYLNGLFPNQNQDNSDTMAADSTEVDSIALAADSAIVD